MPNTQIETRRQCTPDQERKIIDAVHSVMVEGLVCDKTIHLVAHEPHRCPAPPGKSDRCTLISIDLFAGRSFNAKKSLYRAIVRNLEPLDIPGDHVKITLRESPSEN